MANKSNDSDTPLKADCNPTWPQLVRHWRFPMGDKIVDIYIHGDGELTEEDDGCFRDFLNASWRTFNVRLCDDDPRNPKYRGACGGTMGNEDAPSTDDLRCQNCGESVEHDFEHHTREEGYSCLANAGQHPTAEAP
jgi:hypothetical protein